MNINKVNFRSVENLYKNNKSQVKTVENKSADKVEISELGRYLNKVNANKEDINIEKVNEISKRIENGTYQVDSKALAKKIIEHIRSDV